MGSVAGDAVVRSVPDDVDTLGGGYTRTPDARLALLGAVTALRFRFGPDEVDWRDEYRLIPMAFDNGQWQVRTYDLSTGESGWRNVGPLVRGTRLIVRGLSQEEE
jgi:hypothetical protein